MARDLDGPIRYAGGTQSALNGPVTPPQAAPERFDALKTARKEAIDEQEKRQRELSTKQEREDVDRIRRLVDMEYRLKKDKEEELERRRVASAQQQQQTSKISGIANAAGSSSLSGKVSGIGGAIGGSVGAALGPIGAVIQVVEFLGRKVADSIQAVGDKGAQIAKLDTAIFGDVAEGLAAKAGPFWGPIFEEGIKASRKFYDALDGTAKRLAQFNPTIAAAQGQREVAQLLGDIRRAKELEKEFAGFVNAQTRFEQTGQDLLAKALKPLIPIATAILEGMTQILQMFGNLGITVGNLPTALGSNDNSAKITAILNILLGIRKNTKLKEPDPADMLINQLLMTKLPKMQDPPRIPGQGFGPDVGQGF